VRAATETALDSTSGEFRFIRIESVIYGAGTVRALGRELERRGCKRALIVTGATLGSSKLLGAVRDGAGAAYAGVFTGATQHVPSSNVDALAGEARRVEADALVSFGGGSPIDCAKAAAMRLMGERELVHIALPTTLSAAEFTPFGGITDEKTRAKGGVGDPRLQPRVVILDPELTAATPAWLWASTGMRALDHAVECSYSTRHQPLSDVLATRAIAMLTEHLRPSLQGGADELEHRVRCQLAAWFSIFGAINTRSGISHALGHQIGPFWNVPHGVTSCITLPHVMRFMAGVAPERFGPIAEGFGIRFASGGARAAALECADRAARFIAQFEVPTRLRDVGVPREELGRIAQTVLAEVERAGVVGRTVTVQDLIALLEAAY
jgi:maleylacetate reductase